MGVNVQDADSSKTHVILISSLFLLVLILVSCNSNETGTVQPKTSIPLPPLWTPTGILQPVTTLETAQPQAFETTILTTPTPYPSIDTQAPTDESSAPLIPTPGTYPSGPYPIVVGIRHDGESYDIYVVNLDGSGLQNLTGSFDPNAYLRGASPDGRRVVFRPPEEDPWGEGKTTIMLINIDGSGLTDLTSLLGMPGYPRWSPDSQYFGFLRGSEDEQYLYIARSDGTGLRRVTIQPGYLSDPSWATDSQKLFFAMNRGEGPILNEFSLSGDEVTPLYATTGLNLLWSPDRSRFISDIWNWGCFDLTVFDSGETKEGCYPYPDEVSGVVVQNIAYNFRWSPDGNWLAFLTYHGGFYPGYLYMISDDATELRELAEVHYREMIPIPIAWSPDSQAIAYMDSEYYGGQLDVFKVNVTDGKVVNLTNKPSEEYPFSWSPDGEYLLFSSNYQGRDGLYVMESDGTQHRLVLEGDVDRAIWLPDSADEN